MTATHFLQQRKDIDTQFVGLEHLENRLLLRFLGLKQLQPKKGCNRIEILSDPKIDLFQHQFPLQRSELDFLQLFWRYHMRDRKLIHDLPPSKSQFFLYKIVLQKSGIIVAFWVEEM